MLCRSSEQRPMALVFQSVPTHDSIGTITKTVVSQQPDAGAGVEERRDFLERQLDSLTEQSVLGTLTVLSSQHRRAGGAPPPPQNLHVVHVTHSYIVPANILASSLLLFCLSGIDTIVGMGGVAHPGEIQGRGAPTPFLAPQCPLPQLFLVFLRGLGSNRSGVGGLGRWVCCTNPPYHAPRCPSHACFCFVETSRASMHWVGCRAGGGADGRGPQNTPRVRHEVLPLHQRLRPGEGPLHRP